MPTWVDKAMTIFGATSPSELAVLGGLLRNSSFKRVLEVGHWAGRSTAAILQTLPPAASFVSIDHHLGDANIGPSPVEVFQENVAPFENGHDVTYFFDDFKSVLPTLAPFDFVFYDGDHSLTANREFWACVPLERACTLVMDDADWEGQVLLQELAVADGFVDVTPHPINRAPKASPDCLTVCVMRRDS